MSGLEPGKARMTYPDPGVEDAIVDAAQVPHLEHAGWRYAEGDREDWPEELQRFEGGASGVYIRNLNTGGTAFVPELSGHLRERGWVEVGSADDQQAQADQLDDKTVPELRVIARERGISPIPSTKAELLDALSAEPEQVLEQEAQEDAGEPAPSKEDEG